MSPKISQTLFFLFIFISSQAILQSKMPHASEPKHNYYTHIRRDILPFINQSQYNNVLEIGCGQGLTLKYLQDHDLAQTTYGIELDPHQSQIAQHNVDHIIQGDIETLPLPITKFDLILLLDVLEHLHNPQQLLTKLKSHLTRQGIILISVPNIQHISVLKQLLTGRWDYTNSGIMDRTHVHLFTRKTIIEMITQTGYQIQDIRYNGGFLPGYKSLLNFISGNRLRQWFISQWLIKAVLNN